MIFLCMALGSSKQVSELPYEVSGTSSDKADALGGPRRGRLFREQHTNTDEDARTDVGLFSGFTFLLFGDFSPPNPTKAGVTKLIIASGAKFYHPPSTTSDSPPSAWAGDASNNNNANNSRGSKIIVLCAERTYEVTNHSDEIQRLLSEGNAQFVEKSWFFDCVSSFSILPSQCVRQYQVEFVDV